MVTLNPQLASAEGLTAYWRHADTTHISSMTSSAEVQQALHSAIGTSDPSKANAAGTVIRPASLRLMMTHNDDPYDAEGPRYSASFELKDLGTHIAAEQVRPLQVIPRTQMHTHVSQGMTPGHQPCHCYCYCYCCCCCCWNTTEPVIRSFSRHSPCYEVL